MWQLRRNTLCGGRGRTGASEGAWCGRTAGTDGVGIEGIVRGRMARSGGVFLWNGWVFTPFNSPFVLAGWLLGCVVRLSGGTKDLGRAEVVCSVRRVVRNKPAGHDPVALLLAPKDG